MDFYFNGRCFFDLASMQILLLQLALKIVAYYHFSLMQISSAPVPLQSFRCKYVCWFLVFKWRFIFLPTSIDFLSQIGPHWDRNVCQITFEILCHNDFTRYFNTRKASSLVCQKNKWHDLWRELINNFLKGWKENILACPRKKKKNAPQKTKNKLSDKFTSHQLFCDRRKELAYILTCNR